MIHAHTVADLDQNALQRARLANEQRTTAVDGQVAATAAGG
jgi:hypothetical protein